MSRLRGLERHTGACFRVFDPLCRPRWRSPQRYLGRDRCFDEAVWTVPSHKMKAAREHRVPLGDRALAILREMAALRTDDTALVFAGRNGKLNDSIFRNLLRRLRPPRRHRARLLIFVSRFGGPRDTNFPREIAEAALAHVSGDATDARIAAATPSKKRRKLMEAWQPSAVGRSRRRDGDAVTGTRRCVTPVQTSRSVRRRRRQQLRKPVGCFGHSPGLRSLGRSLVGTTQVPMTPAIVRGRGRVRDRAIRPWVGRRAATSSWRPCPILREVFFRSLRLGRPPKKSGPRSLFLRDLWIAAVVTTICKHHKLNPYRNEESLSERPCCGCSVVAEALNRLGIKMTELSVKRIYIKYKKYKQA